jgi:hypothetical protein
MEFDAIPYGKGVAGFVFELAGPNTWETPRRTRAFSTDALPGRWGSTAARSSR